MARPNLTEYVSSAAYLFPGQGSQAVGMGRDLADAYPPARAAFEEADDTLGFSLSRLCFEGPEEALTDTINTQPALMATSVAAARALEAALVEAGVQPQRSTEHVYAAGHSMGEYTALVAAGALSYADGLRLVRERGRLMKEAGEKAPGMMAAILGLDEAQVSAVCADVSARAAWCRWRTTIALGRSSYRATSRAWRRRWRRCSRPARKVAPLAVSIAAHSPLMQPAAEELAAAIAATPIRAAGSHSRQHYSRTDHLGGGDPG